MRFRIEVRLGVVPRPGREVLWPELVTLTKTDGSMVRYRYREERVNRHYVIRDAFSGDLIPHAVLDGPEMFGTLQRVHSRIADLEGRRRHGGVEAMITWSSGHSSEICSIPRG